MSNKHLKVIKEMQMETNLGNTKWKIYNVAEDVEE